MVNDLISPKGTVHFVLTDANGNVTERKETNLVVTTGLGYIASRMKDTTATIMSHMAVGTGTANAAAGDTALGTESARVSLTSQTVTGAYIEYVATFAAGTPASATAITEAGIFNAGSSGTMLCRTKFDVINKGIADTLTITWRITLAAS